MNRKKKDYIFLTADEVREILVKGSHQIRRKVSLRPPCGCFYRINGNKSHALCFAKSPDTNFDDVLLSVGNVKLLCVPPTPKSTNHRLPCSYGAPGDILWVKETWCPLDYPGHAFDPTLSRDAILYDGRKNGAAYKASCLSVDSERCRKKLGYKWQSPITMPRWASRLTLEIMDIDIEHDNEYLWLISFRIIEP